MYKGLVTSGCSFSLYDISHNKHGWPFFLQHKLVQDGYLSKEGNMYKGKKRRSDRYDN